MRNIEYAYSCQVAIPLPPEHFILAFWNEIQISGAKVQFSEICNFQEILKIYRESLPLTFLKLIILQTCVHVKIDPSTDGLPHGLI